MPRVGRALESRIAIIFTVEATGRPNRIVAHRLVRIHCDEAPKTTSYRKCGHIAMIGGNKEHHTIAQSRTILKPGIADADAGNEEGETS